VRIKKYIIIALLLNIFLHNNINPMEKEHEYESNLLENIPHELLKIIHEKIIYCILNDWHDINDFMQVKENIKNSLLNMSLASTYIYKSVKKYDKDGITKLIRLLIKERLAYLIKENKKNYKGIYKALSKEELNNKFNLLISKYNYDNKMIFSEIVELILAGANVNIQNTKGNTPLVWSACHGNKDVVELLIAADVNIDILDKCGYTALILAAENGHTDVVRLLLASDASINMQNNNGYTALQCAARSGYIDIVKLLIAARANTDIQDSLGFTALIETAHYGHTDIVKLLIDNGADVNIKNRNLFNVLIWAVNRGYKEIAILLIKGGVKNL